MRVTFSPRALSDLEAIGDYIAKDSSANAVDFVDQVLDRCMDIADAPQGYIARPELGENIRSVAFKNYVIFYSVNATNVRVERILQGSRDYLRGEFL